jgi:HEAT repeat protein
MPSPAGIPGASTNAMGNRASWEDWWHFNKDPFLELKRAVSSGLPTTAADELLSGPSRRAVIDPEILRSRVAPALRALLENERSPEIITAALVALARVCGPSGVSGTLSGGGSTGTSAESATIALFESRLHDANQEIAETAALALGILRSEDSLPILEALLAESPRGRELVGGRAVSDRTRAFAAYGLGLVGTAAKNNRARQIVARALSASLARNDSLTARAAPVVDIEVAAVIALSIDRVDPERGVSTPSSSGPNSGASASAAWFSRQSQMRFLRGTSEAPDSLHAEAQDEILGALRARSKLENAPLQSCAQALGLLGSGGIDAPDRKLRLALIQVLEDADVQGRCFALIALAEMGGRSPAGNDEEEGPAVFRNLITDQLIRGRGMTRPWAAIALGVLERRLADGRSSPSKKTEKQTNSAPGAEARGGIGGQGSAAEIAAAERSREILRSYFASAKQRTHIGAGAVALGLSRDRKAVPLLLERLGDTSEDQGQGYLALALGMIGDEQAVVPLKELVRASKYKPEIMEQASIALALLGDKSTAPELAEMLAKAQGQAAQASIATALGRIGDVRTIDPLLRLIDRKDLTASARAFAAAALGQVADTEPLPWYTPIALDLNYVATTGTLLAGDGTGLLEIL